MVDPGLLQVVVAIATTALGYLAWVGRKASSWIDSHEQRVDKNETRSAFNREAIDQTSEDVDAADLPPADDPANDRFESIGGDS